MEGTSTDFRRRRRRDTQRAIVEAAMARLASGGLEGLTMRRLAKDLGCTEPAIYRYFASKDALLAALTREVVDGLEATIERAFEVVDARAPEPLRPIARVIVAAEVYAAVMRERTGEATLLTLVLGDPRYLVEREASLPTVEAVERLLARVATSLADAEAEGRVGPGDAMGRAVLLWTSAHGAAQLRKFDRFGVAHLEVSAVRAAFVKDLLAAWGAERSDVEASLELAASVAAALVPAGSSPSEEE